MENCRPATGETSLPAHLETSAKEYLDYLADAFNTLQELSNYVEGGFERCRVEVRSKALKGMPLPEAIHSVIKEIVDGKFA